MSRRTRRNRSRREANGRWQRESMEYRENINHGRYQRRWLKPILERLHLPEALLSDPHCGDSLGLLMVTRFISEGAYQAGVRYRDTALAYRRVHGLPSGLPRLMGDKGISHYEADPRLVAAVTRRYLSYRLAIQRAGGRPAMRVVHQVCASDRMCDQSELEYLAAGLQALTHKHATGSGFLLRIAEVGT